MLVSSRLLQIERGDHSFADEAAYRSYHSALTQSQEWITSIVPALQMWGASLEDALELLPTRRSLLCHRAEEQ